MKRHVLGWIIILVLVPALAVLAAPNRYSQSWGNGIEARLNTLEAKVAALEATTTTQPTTTTTAATTTTTQATTTTTAATTTTTIGSQEQFPNPASTGVPAGWTPVTSRSTDLTVTQAGAVVENIRFTGGAGLIVNAVNVTVRQVEFQGGSIFNWPGATCYNGLVIEDTSFVGPSSATNGAIGVGGYTARGVEISDYSEGFRVGGSPACGPVVIENTYVRIIPPVPCGDWHGDGLQGYGGGALTVRNMTVDFIEDSCGGTAPFFYPSGQGNTSVDIDRLLVKGGGYSFREGMPGSVTGLRIVDGSWSYGPIDVNCSALTSWEAAIVTIDTAYRTSIVRAQPCNTSGGS